MSKTTSGIPGKKQQPDAEPKGPDETEVRQTAVVASTFANVELQSTRQTLQQYVQLYQSAREENVRLSTELADRDKDSMSVVHFLRNELEKKQEQIKEQQKKTTEEMEALQQKFNDERKGYIAQLDEKQEQNRKLEETVSDMEADLDALEAFKRERNEMHLELSKFKEQQLKDNEKYQAEISNLRFQSLEEKVRLKAEERTLSEKFEKEVNAKAMKLLDGKTKEIHSENYMLVQDKVLLEKELERISKQNQEFEAQLRKERLDAELGTSTEADIVKRNAKLSRSNKQLQEKNSQLEQNLVQVVDKYEAQLSQTTDKLTKKLRAMTVDRDDANHNAEGRHKELIRMRQLTRQVVGQRTDLETFFNEALEYVRSEIAKERVLAFKAGRQAPPSLGMKPHQPKGPKQPTATEFLEGNFEALPGGIESAGGTNNTAGPGTSVVPASAGATRDLPTRGSLHTRHSSSASSLPPIPSAQGSRVNTAGGGTAPSTADGRRVDISELSWVDKERVLRILFSKINQVRHERHAVKKQQTWREGGSREGALPTSVPVAAIEAPPRMVPAEGDETFLTTDPYE